MISLGCALIEKIGVHIKKETWTSRPTERRECHVKMQTQSKDGHGKTETKT